MRPGAEVTRTRSPGLPGTAAAVKLGGPEIAIARGSAGRAAAARAARGPAGVGIARAGAVPEDRVAATVAALATAGAEAPAGERRRGLLLRPVEPRLVAQHGRTARGHDAAAGRRGPILHRRLGSLPGSHLGQPLESLTGFGHGPRLDLGQRRVGRREGERPVLVDELVAEVAAPRLKRLAGRVVGHHARRPHQEQRVGLGFGLARRGRAGGEILPGRPQAAGQRIAGPGWAFEVGRPQPDALRLKKHAVDAALDVERPPMGARLAFVGNDGVGRRAVRRVLAGSLERRAGLGQLPLEVLDHRLVGLVATVVGRGVERGGGPLEFGQFIGQRPPAFLDAGQTETGLGQIGGRLVPHAAELLEPPGQFVPQEG